MRIDNEFKNLIPALTDEEYKGLEQSILSEGCRDALVLWGDILIDGHNRYEICTKHGIEYRTVQRDFDSRNDAILWMMQNQLSRRNLNGIQRIEIAHKCEDVVKAKAKERQGTRTDTENFVEKFPERRARDELGKMAGVSGKTYERGVAVLEETPEPVIEATRKNDISINMAYEVSKMDEGQKGEIADRIEQGESPKEVIRDVQKKPHVAFNSGNNEWYTPQEYIEAARLVMGSIDTDPASSELANKVVGAKRIYTAECNGLLNDWIGNVWMNPPYSSDLIGRFADKLVEQRKNYIQAIVLVNNATETEWFNKMIDLGAAVCFPRSRIKFNKPDGSVGSPLQGQAVIYIGDNKKRFTDTFNKIGWCAYLNEV